MKKIAYIELDTHSEIASNFMELMDDSAIFDVDYFFSSKINEIINIQNQNIIITNPNSLIKELKKSKYDFVIIGTVHRYFNIFEKIAEQYKTAIICHNLNFVKASNFDLLKAIFKENFKFRLKLLFRESLLKKSKVYRKAKNLFVLEKEIFLQNNENNNIKELPLFYNKYDTQSENKILNIVIPGAVSQKRRNYISVIEKLKNLKIEKSESGLEIVFLGKASGKELQELKKIEKEIPTHITIKYFTEKVSQLVFDEYMKNADMLWCPIKQATEFFSQKEFYGKTKLSGNIGDAIKYGEFAIFPKNYISSYKFIIQEEKDIMLQFQKIKNIHFDFQLNYNKKDVLKKLETALLNLSNKRDC